MSITTVWRLARIGQVWLTRFVSDLDDLEIEAGSGSHGRLRSGRTTRRPQRLQRLFGDPLPEREVAMWSLMDTAQRASALQRANALIRYNDGKGDVPARTAAADAGVTLVRFYQMNARWRDGPSLAALGVGAQPERGRRSQFSPEVNAVLQSAAAEVASDDDASVRALALRLADIARAKGLSEEDLPGHNTLRGIVERARRERDRRRKVGNQLLLDHAACGIMREDGSPWTAFVIVDAATQLILGAAPDGANAVECGYADAARDAARRIAASTLARVAWADRLAQVQLVPGAGNGAAFERVVAEARSIGIGLNLTSDRKAGRYLEHLVGRSIGVLPLWPARVGAAELPPWAAERAPVLDLERARARMVLAVEDHNARLLDSLGDVGDGVPPPELMHLLEMLAR